MSRQFIGRNVTFHVTVRIIRFIKRKRRDIPSIDAIHNPTLVLCVCECDKKCTKELKRFHISDLIFVGFILGWFIERL